METSIFSVEHILRAHERARHWESQIDGWATLADPPIQVADIMQEGHHGSSSRALAGVPFGVKDIIDVRGFPTRFGSLAFEGASPAQKDAAVVMALREAGANPIGKTRTTEFAFIDPTTTRNPYNPRHTPGGSSSGSGAVVGAGVVPFALGTQTAGSLIRPACYCGATAYKPTLHALPTDGVSPLSHSFDQVGIIAGSAEWLEKVFAVLARAFSLGKSPGVPAMIVPKAQLRIAQINVPEQTPNAELVEAIAAARSHLGTAGHTIEYRDTPVSFTALLAAHRTIMLYEAAQDLLKFVGNRRAKLQPKLSAALAEGEQISDQSYAVAKDDVAQSRKRFWSEMASYDLLLAYPVSGAAPNDLTTTGDQSYLSPWTALGGPLLSLPAGLDSDEMPLGIMFAAAPGEDAMLMAQARSLEVLIGGITAPELVPASP